MMEGFFSRRRLGNPAGLKLDGAPLVGNSGSMRIGRNVFLASRPVASHLITESGAVLTIGDDVAIGYGAAIYCQRELCIGDGSRLAPYCVIADTDFHVIGDSNRRPEPRPIHIGNRVRIGARVNILPGSDIGDEATVLAGSTVAGHVPAGAVVGGVPAATLLAHADMDGNLEERVRQLVRDALGLNEAPADNANRAGISQWDSLAALRIALSVEGQFSISLSERDVTAIHCIGDLIAIVTRRTTLP